MRSLASYSPSAVIQHMFGKHLAVLAMLASIGLWSWVPDAAATQFQNRSFETGTLGGWDYIGGTSVFGDDLGIDPTHGQKGALLTTSMGPDKGVPGTPLGTTSSDFLQWLGLGYPPPAQYGAWQSSGNIVAEIGAHSGLRQSVSLQAGDVVSFDWNRAGDEVDRAFALFYASNSPFYTGSYAELTAPFVLPNTITSWQCGGSGNPGDPDCIHQTGWHSYSFVAPANGDYSLTLGVFDRQDDGWLSALLVDNFRINAVPEPSTVALFGLVLGGLAFVLRPSARRQLAA